MTWFFVGLLVQLVVVTLIYFAAKRIARKGIERLRAIFRRRMEDPRPLFKAERDVYFNREYAKPEELRKSA